MRLSACVRLAIGTLAAGTIIVAGAAAHSDQGLRAAAPGPPLVPIPGSPFTFIGAGFGAQVLLLSPDGKRLFVTDGGSVTSLSVAPDGALAFVETLEPQDQFGFMLGMALNPDADRLYVAKGGRVQVFSVAPDGSLGLLQTQVTDPFAVGFYSDGIAYMRLPGGDHIYINAAVPGSNFVNRATVNPDGSVGAPLPRIPTGGIGAGGGPEGNSNLRAADVHGLKLFVANAGVGISEPDIPLPSDDVSVFHVLPDGGLSPVPGSPFAPPGLDFGMRGSIAVDAVGGYLYANGDGPTGRRLVSRMRIEADGTLRPAGVFTTGLRGDVQGLEVDGCGGLLAATSSDSNEIALIDTATMTPVPGSPIPGDEYPTIARFSRDGSLLFAGNDAYPTKVSVYRVMAPSACAPEVACPAPLTAECTASSSAEVALAVHVEDRNGDPLDVTWSVDGTVARTEAVPAGGPPTSADLEFTHTYPLGGHAVDVTADDGASRATCSTGVTVVDTTPPAVTCTTVAGIWPPDGSLVDAGLSVDVADCDADPSLTVEVFSDEAPAGGVAVSSDGGVLNGGPGAARSFYASGAATVALRLRAERDPGSDGRVYLIAVRAADNSGYSGFDCCAVGVPHDRGNGSMLAIDVQTDAARAHCLSHRGAPPPGFTAVPSAP